MSKNIALKVAGTLFSIVALMHLLRLIFHSEIMISGYHIPMWFSMAGLVIALGLAIWMFIASKS